MVGDLTTPRWSQTSTGVLRIEEKDEIKKRIGRSTDRGDAIVMVYMLEVVSPTRRVAGEPVGMGGPSYWHHDFGGADR